ncbi:MAG: AmmeMemoRadiSam system protein A [Gammaproteobacteria bacterium]|jgi:AmmeMemoRadiSam system protein A
MHSSEYGSEERAALLKIARNSIEYGLTHRRALPISPEDYPEHLREERASFVTLKRHDALRGCVGGLAAYEPLVVDVSDHAYQAAFGDPRFPVVERHELADLEIGISVLSRSEPLEFSSEQDLVAQLRPGEDGLILEDGLYRGTFLPSVWEQLPEPGEFLRQLKQKAGLMPDYWSDSLRVERYTTEHFV